MNEICPLPKHWNQVTKLHRKAAERDQRSIPNPPVPLILNGWVYSNDLEKRERWNQTIDWAEKWGFSEIIRGLEPQMKYWVEHPSEYVVGPMGGPMHLPWSFESKPNVSHREAEQAVGVLRSKWGNISGSNLCKVTWPLRLTGRKRRRLVVYADPGARALWGTWTELSAGTKRREFTRFRAVVNTAINPLEINHIDFVHEKPDQDL